MKKKQTSFFIWLLLCIQMIFLMACGPTTSTINTPSAMPGVSSTPNPTVSTSSSPTPAPGATVAKRPRAASIIIDSLGEECRLNEDCVMQISADIEENATGVLIVDPGYGDVQRLDLLGGPNNKSLIFRFGNLPNYDGSQVLHARVHATTTANGLTTISPNIVFDLVITGSELPGSGDISSTQATPLSNGTIQIEWTVSKNVTSTFVEVTKVSDGVLVSNSEVVHPSHNGLTSASYTTVQLTSGQSYRIKLTPVNADKNRGPSTFITPDVVIKGIASSNFKAESNSKGEIDVTWAKVDQAVGYRIFWKNLKTGGEDFSDRPNNETELIIGSDKVPFGYKYEISGAVKDATGQFSSRGVAGTINFETLPQIGVEVGKFPENVVGFREKLVVSLKGGTSPVSPLAKTLKWYRTIPGEPFSQVKETLVSEQTVIFDGLKEGTTYYAAVTQCRDGACSSLPTVFDVTALDGNTFVGHNTTGPALGTLSVPAVTFVGADPDDPVHKAVISIGTITVAGADRSNVRYTVYVSTSRGSGYNSIPGLTSATLLGADPSKVSILNVYQTGLDASTTYYYKVRAELWDGERMTNASTLSAETAYTTPCAAPGQTCGSGGTTTGNTGSGSTGNTGNTNTGNTGSNSGSTQVSGTPGMRYVNGVVEFNTAAISLPTSAGFTKSVSSGRTIYIARGANWKFPFSSDQVCSITLKAFNSGWTPTYVISCNLAKNTEFNITQPDNTTNPSNWAWADFDLFNTGAFGAKVENISLIIDSSGNKKFKTGN